MNNISRKKTCFGNDDHTIAIRASLSMNIPKYGHFMNIIGSVIESVLEVTVGQLIGRWLVGQVFIISLKGREITLPCSYRSTF